MAELHKLPIALHLLAQLSGAEGSFDSDDWEIIDESPFVTPP